MKLRRQIIFWLIYLAANIAIAAEHGWHGSWLIFLFINSGIAIFSLCISGYARSIKRFGSMSPEQREEALSKMPPFARDRIVQDLKKKMPNTALPILRNNTAERRSA